VYSKKFKLPNTTCTLTYAPTHLPADLYTNTQIIHQQTNLYIICVCVSSVGFMWSQAQNGIFVRYGVVEFVTTCSVLLSVAELDRQVQALIHEQEAREHRVCARVWRL